MVLQESKCAISDPMFDYEVDIDDAYGEGSTKATTIRMSRLNDEDELSEGDGITTIKRTLRMLHLTDIHYDPKYKAGSSAVCEEPTCCRGVSRASKVLWSF